MVQIVEIGSYKLIKAPPQNRNPQSSAKFDKVRQNSTSSAKFDKIRQVRQSSKVRQSSSKFDKIRPVRQSSAKFDKNRPVRRSLSDMLNELRRTLSNWSNFAKLRQNSTMFNKDVSSSTVFGYIKTYGSYMVCHCHNIFIFVCTYVFEPSLSTIKDFMA